MNTPLAKYRLSANLMAEVAGYSRLVGEDERATPSPIAKDASPS